MKTDIKNEQTTVPTPVSQPEIMRLSLRVRTKLKTGAFATAPCPTNSCHC